MDVEQRQAGGIGMIRETHQHIAFTKRTGIVLAVIVLAIAMTAVVGTTVAYFTTYATARGYIELPIDQRTEINEDFGDWTKRVTITNAEDSTAVFVRAKGYAGSEYTLDYSSTDANWVIGEDDYYYYRLPLDTGQTTPTLNVRIGNVPADAHEGDQFNVVVIYETTPVLYDESGRPYADWNVILDNGNSEGGE